MPPATAVPTSVTVPSLLLAGAAEHAVGFVTGVLVAHNICTALWRELRVVAPRPDTVMLMPKGTAGDLLLSRAYIKA